MRGELARFGAPSGLADLVERWTEVVGEGIARNAWPARIARDGTLHVTTSDSVWAFELGHRAAEIAQRLDVVKVKFAPGQLPSAEGMAPSARPVSPSADHIREAAEIAAGIDDEALRRSVQKAVGLGLARAAEDRPI